MEKTLPDSLRSRTPGNYLLVSQDRAVTGWHTDFIGTSVFYYLLSGVKEFFVIQPTDHNKELVERYMEENTACEQLFHDSDVEGNVHKVVVLPGQGLLMPTRTPHLVRTVVGGIARGINFIWIDHIGYFYFYHKMCAKPLYLMCHKMYASGYIYLQARSYRLTKGNDSENPDEFYPHLPGLFLSFIRGKILRGEKLERDEALLWNEIVLPVLFSDNVIEDTRKQWDVYVECLDLFLLFCA